MSAQILILSDDPEAARIWSHTLDRQQVESVTRPYGRVVDLTKGLTAYDLVIIDDYQNVTDVFDLCRVVRAANPHPLLLFTYESDERYHLKAYQVGVDECVAKPIGIRLCQQKVFAWLRRVERTREPSSPMELEVANFRLDAQLRLLMLPTGKSVRLSRLEHRLMYALMSNRGQIMETELLLSRIWDDYTVVDRQMLKNLVYRLRRKVEPVPQHPRHIKAVTHMGYIFEAD